jgi:hypothetical protein
MTRRFHPGIPAISFILWWIIPSVLFPNRLLNADGDLLRHIGHGNWMLQHHALISADPFSFTKGAQPFVGFEYGSQLIYALVHQVAGLAGVAIFAGLLIATAYALLAKFLLSRGVDPLLTYLTTVAGAILGAVHWAARPHLFTLVLVVVLLFMLEARGASDNGPMKGAAAGRPYMALPLFAIWANLHGGWLFGLVLIGLWFAGRLLDYLLKVDRAFQLSEMRRLAAMFGFGLLGTLINPHFLALHRHVFGFFGDTYILDHTHEFLSPDFHGVVGKMFLTALLLTMAVLAMSRTRPSGPMLVVTLAMTAFTLNAQRNIQLFSVTVIPLLALHVDAAFRRLPDWRGIRGVFERDAKVGVTAPYVVAMFLVFGALAAVRGQVGGVAVVPDSVLTDDFPVAVVARARKAGLEGRIYNDFTWGGYIIYAWPEQKVFIDGGTDFYGPDLMRTWQMIRDLQPGWRDSLAHFGVNLVLMPPDAAMVHELLRESGWKLRDCDATAALLQKSAGTQASSTESRLLAGCEAGKIQ